MTEMRVPVTVWLPRDAFRRVSQVAEQHETSAGVVVADIVMRSVVPRTTTGRGRSGGKQPYRRLTDAGVATLVILHGKGKSDREIAQHLGVSTSAITHRRYRLGLAANHARPFTDGDTK